MLRLLLCFVVCCTLSFSTDIPVSTVLSKYEIVQVREKWSTEDETHSYLIAILFSAFGEDVEIFIEKTHTPFHHLYRSYIESSDGRRSAGGEEPTELYEGGSPYFARLTRLSEGIYVGSFKWNDEEFHLDPLYLFSTSDKTSCVVYPSSSLKTLPRLSMPSYIGEGSSHAPSFSSFLSTLERVKKQTMSPVKNRCPIKIVADHFFFSRVAHNSTAKATRFMAGLIDRVNHILTTTDFGRDENGVQLINMGLSIRHALVHEGPTLSSEGNDYNSPKPTLLQQNREIPWNISNLLKAFSKSDAQDTELCMRILLTAREMDTATRGEAYVATQPLAGICARPHLTNIYNTLVVSVVDGQMKPSRVLVTREIDLITAHEIGHSWGAEHDAEKRCLPAFKNGSRFIMYEYTSGGYDENNSKFSPCSREQMGRILNDRREMCFIPEQASKCGNGVVEEGEECDEGGRYYDGATRCCTYECTLPHGKLCSPVNDPCCSAECSYSPKGRECLQTSSSHCSRSSFCTGESASCPVPSSLADGTSCLDGGECFNGTCVPYCERKDINKKNCMCEEEELSCHRCCLSTSTMECLPEKGSPNLPNGATCLHGRCSNSTCVREPTDIVFRLNQLVKHNSIMEIVKNNLVLIIVTTTSIVWIPIAIWVHRHDKEKEKLAHKSVRDPPRGMKQVTRNVTCTPAPQNHFAVRAPF